MVSMHFADDTYASDLAFAVDQINGVIEGSLKELTDDEVNYFFPTVTATRGVLSLLIGMAVAADAHIVKRMEADYASDPS